MQDLIKDANGIEIYFKYFFSVWSSCVCVCAMSGKNKNKKVLFEYSF